MSLPTYEQANSGIDVLELVAPYIPISNLPKCCLVSKRWRSIFMSVLWTEPTKVSCSAPDVLGSDFKSLVMRRRAKFLNSIHTVSRETRSLVSVLDFRLPIQPLHQQIWKSGHDEEYLLYPRNSERKPTSLLDVLLHDFPALKFILVDGQACGASPSLQKSTHRTAPASYSSPPRMNMAGHLIPRPSKIGEGENVAQPPVRKPSANIHPILFSAQRTDLTVAQVMRTESFHSLLYLDISYLSKTGGFRGLFSQHSFPHLRVLKLRGLHLNDSDLADVLSGLKTNLWGLDVRDNYLTDLTAFEIAGLALPRRLPPPEVLSPLNQAWYEEAPPVYYASERQEAFDHRIKIPFRSDDDDQIMRTLQEYPNELHTHGPTSGLGLSVSLTHITGLTNLHISNNKLTSEGVEKILETNDRLQLLDVGTVRQKQSNDNSLEAYKATIKLPSDILTDLEHLRIHHSLVTGISTASTNRHNPKTIQRSESLASTENSLFNPHSNPTLRHLTLTNLPRFTFGLLIDRLTLFLRHAAILEACCRPPQPPSKNGPQMKPGLQILELEFEKLNDRDGVTSVSGDPDADEFMLQSENDFSFFDNRDEGVRRHKNVVDEREGLRDVAEELKTWRRSVKSKRDAEFERVGGRVELMRVEAHCCWSGTLKLIL